MKPHPNNFCGGNFPSWLEVMLTSKCNGSCSWCIEKEGHRPTKVADWSVLVKKILETGKEDILLLGGEPTLYKNLRSIVQTLHAHQRNVYITTNGSCLSEEYVNKHLSCLSWINISIHSYDLAENQKITGVNLNTKHFYNAVERFHKLGIPVRLNCNIIKAHIDSEDEALKYIEFAKYNDISSVRFAELKLDEENFVCLADIFDNKYGLNKDPFTLGCNLYTEIDGIDVNFRQMCGLQTSLRPRPENPEFAQDKKVLYYDGEVYNGWQTARGETNMTKEQLEDILKRVKEEDLDVETAAIQILTEHNAAVHKSYLEGVEDEPGGCVY